MNTLEQNKQNRRQVRNYLINSRLQLRYAIGVVLTTLVLTGVIAYFWFINMREASSALEANALSMLSDVDVSYIREDLLAADRQRLIILTVFAVVLSIILFLYWIYFTHKIAGPLHKLKNYLLSLRDGIIPSPGKLRKGDQLNDVWEVVIEVSETLRTQEESEITQLQGLMTDADEKTRRVLADIVTAKKKRLG